MLLEKNGIDDKIINPIDDICVTIRWNAPNKKPQAENLRCPFGDCAYSAESLAGVSFLLSLLPVRETLPEGDLWSLA